jgi:hypothetical protein
LYPYRWIKVKRWVGTELEKVVLFVDQFVNDGDPVSSMEKMFAEDRS